MKNSIVNMIALCISFIFFPGITPADTRSCYDAVQDADGDGYARSGASATTITVSQSQKISCPNGYVRLEGDCYDADTAGNRDRHPRRTEVSYDTIDNNCNGLTDEPSFVYPQDNNNNWVTASSFQVKIKINDGVLRDAWRNGRSVGVEATLVPLSQSSPLPAPVNITDIEWEPAGDTLYAILTIPAVSNRVYRTQIQFVDTGLGNLLGSHTDWYYTSTTGLNEEDQRRTGILLRGFHELNESQEGRVGYLGTSYVDGVKYGARPTEQWCSEFYAWAARPFLKGVANETSVPQLIRFFNSRDAYRSKNDISSTANSEDFRGDYLPQYEGKTKIMGHSSMFLAYDNSQDLVWTLEGNVGDGISVEERGFDKLSGHGHIEYKKLLCEQWCADNEECVKCDTNSNCGVGYERLRSWSGRGTNWHACAEKARSRDNHAACEQWCASDSRCVKCDTNRECGVGYERLNSWTGPGTNWHACAEKARSRDNHAACDQWCGNEDKCVKCSTKRGCGPGYKNLRSWTGEGTNWHACAAEGRTRDHQAECEEWCASDSRCVKCDTNRECGVGYERLKSWTGTGVNWHACAEKERSRDNHTDCQEWCNSDARCVKCDTNRECGVGYERLKSWTGAGTNWHACAEKARSSDNHAACEQWCRNEDKCVKCSTKRGCGMGYKNLRSWTGKGTNWHACGKK